MFLRIKFVYKIEKNVIHVFQVLMTKKNQYYDKIMVSYLT